MVFFKLKKLNLPKKWPGKKNAKVLDEDITIKQKGVYLFFDKELNLVYIGRTQNLRSRILQHVSPKTTQRWTLKDFYDGYKQHYYHSKLPLGCVAYYAFIEIENYDDADLTENILIKLLKPHFNVVKTEEAWESYATKNTKNN